MYRFQNKKKWTAPSSAVSIYTALPFNLLNYVMLYILRSYKCHIYDSE